jgi:lysophospholipase L1-like esterase
MDRGLSRTIVGAAGIVLGLWAQVRWVAHHDYPEYPDLDASGVFGDPRHPRLSIALFGDSTITGPGLESADQIWIRQAIERLLPRYFIVLDSYAVGGARVGDVLGDQIPRMNGRRYDIIILSAAANDAIHGLPQSRIRRLLGTALDELLEYCEVVILAGVGDVGTAPRLPPPLSHIATLRARSTDRAHGAVATGRDNVLKVPLWELTTPAFRSGADLFSGDRFHPNACGHGVWAAAIEPVLAEAAALVSSRPADPEGATTPTLRRCSEQQTSAGD